MSAWISINSKVPSGYPRCNIIYSFSLFYRLLLGLGLLLRMFCFLCFTSAVRNKLYYTGDEPFLLSCFFKTWMLFELFYHSVTQLYSEKKPSSATGVEPMTYRITAVARMLHMYVYHLAIGDSWELHAQQ